MVVILHAMVAVASHQKRRRLPYVISSTTFNKTCRLRLWSCAEQTFILLPCERMAWQDTRYSMIGSSDTRRTNVTYEWLESGEYGVATQGVQPVRASINVEAIVGFRVRNPTGEARRSQACRLESPEAAQELKIRLYNFSWRPTHKSITGTLWPASSTVLHHPSSTKLRIRSWSSVLASTAWA